ncbi:hypothetical protein CU633_00685 [Bacillus sp. V3-13]|uniref:heavy-metal-associated domain-containing protein n=1 Tax=Bacillus sp. V3-13 TaxID=2053728 RepID=UPI000C78D34B|nr:heavy metal-associated domain-containing protein [Bacillus sp. V3-13]PLR79282.1 hypothetical protein CU633_00685 [Bacillus sp. V3-13]
METGVFFVKNMSNQQDADKVLNTLLDVWGIGRAEVHLENHQAVFTYDKRMASYQDFQYALIDRGYHAEPVEK